jgi:hypothetical protein
MAIAKGTAMWAKVHRPVANYNKDGYEYTIDLIVDKEEAAKLKEVGATVREKGGDLVVKFKLKVERKDGSKNEPPLIVDADKMPTKEEIGNGSKVRVQYRTYDWEFGKKKGTSIALQAVQVLELVEFKGGTTQAGAEFGDVDEDDAAF